MEYLHNRIIFYTKKGTKMNYRPAGKNDLDLLVQYRLNFIEMHPAHMAYHFMEKSCLHYFMESMENKTFEAIIAEEAQHPIGIGMIFYYRSVPSCLNPTGWNGYITNLFVEEQHRGQGIGRELVKRLVQKAEKRNCYIIMLHASEMGRPLYLKMGFHDITNGMVLNNWEASKKN